MIILGRKEEVGRTIAEEICQQGGACEFMKTDVMNAEAVQQNCDDIMAKYGRIDTLLNAAGGSYTERGQDVIRQTPFGRMGEPEELCGTIHYLMSDASRFVTGTVAVVDGGFNAFAM